MRLPSVTLPDDTKSRVQLALGGLFVLSLLLVVAVAALPTGGQGTTEFYLLGSNDTAAEYPENVTVGETATLQVGIRNDENARQTYTLDVRADGNTLATRTVEVNRGERWEDSVSFELESTGEKRLQLHLYTGESTDGDPYRSLQLFVTVRPS